MNKILFFILFTLSSLSANFFVIDSGKIVEIVNAPSIHTKIIDDAGRVLTKYKSYASANRALTKKKNYTYISQKRNSKYLKYFVVDTGKNVEIAKSTKNRLVSQKIKVLTRGFKSYSSAKKYAAKLVSYKKRRGYTKSVTLSKNVVTKRKKSVANKVAVKKQKFIKNKDYIVIKTAKRKLFYYKNNQLDKVYSIAVGRKQFQHYGTYKISRKKVWPSWTPTKTVIKEHPSIPRFFKGGKRNPLGARAMYLGTSAYRIHGTNNPKSIGKAASHGCFRMKNNDVIALYNKVKIGTTVYIK